MTALATLAALSIAFPKAGHVFPYQTQTYVIGATTGGETNLVIQGRNVSVYRTGGWVTTVSLREGTNTIDVAGSNLCVIVRAKPKPRPETAAKAPEKTWKKLAYAGDAPQVHPAARKPPLKPGEMTIALDAGHGGGATGTVGPHEWPEKDANLKMTLAVRDALERKGYRVALTRATDADVALYDRPKTAYAAKAVAFVSIHHNAPPTDRDPRTCRYHAVYAWNDIGKRLAGAINRRMAAAFGATLANNGVVHANFAVTRNPEIPSCLVEVDFLTTPEGEEASWNAERRERVAAAIADGIADWATTP